MVEEKNDNVLKKVEKKNSYKKKKKKSFHHLMPVRVIKNRQTSFFYIEIDRTDNTDKYT